MSTEITLVVFAVLAVGWFVNGKIKGRRARKMVELGATLVDVRTAEEFRGGHIPGALNIPLQVLDRQHKGIPKGRPVVVYCASGMRSAMAVQVLKQNGHDPVFNMGSMSAW